MNAELVANDYLPYAVASLNAYAVADNTDYVLSRYDDAWEKLSPGQDDGTVHYDVHFKDGPFPQAIVAFRGTRGADFEDWLANLGWFTTLLPIKNAYADARTQFQAIRERVSARANGRPVSYIATGHSLGGALAQHIAAGFPCTSAVVFDTSPVTFQYVFSEPFDQAVVHVFDEHDELTMVREWLFTQRDGPSYRWYPINLVPRGTLQHDIGRFAVGMARMVAMCQHDRPNDCEVPRADTRARDFYCPIYGRGDFPC